MKLNPIGSNQTELTLTNVVILFSYKTPVAAIIRSTGEAFRTAHKWSRTTSKHINSWLGDMNATEKPQEYFDNLVDEAK